MISWLPVAVVLLAVALAVTIATPTVGQPSEPPPPSSPQRSLAGDWRAPDLVGGGQVQVEAKVLKQQQPTTTTEAHSSKSALPSTNATQEDCSNSETNLERQRGPSQAGNELAAIKQIERKADEATRAQLLSSQVSPSSPSSPSSNKSRSSPVYTNQFVIQVEGGELEARKLALKHGFVYLNHILGDYYHLEHQRLSKRSTSAKQDALNISIEDEPQVLLLERQVLKRRVKRDFLELPSAPAANQAAPGSEQVRLAQAHLSQLQQARAGQQQQQQHVQASTRPSFIRIPAHHQYTRPANQPVNPPRVAIGRLLNSDSNRQQQDSLETAATSSSLLYQQQQLANGLTSQQQPGTAKVANVAANGTSINGAQQNNNNNNKPTSFANSTGSAGNGAKQAPFNDPSWPLMWYLDGGAKNGFDLNVMAAWKMGYTGKGIVITILDDGLEKDHPDLQANYDPLASFDINNDDADPMPEYDANDSNRHGTRCAGEVAAVPNNNICSIGIAYNSKVGGVRMLDGDVTDAVEARSLSLNNQHIHIYSASWGPDDNGKTVDGPGEMATRAFMEGVTNGRQGLGSIFVFASGNGGREHDNCNCDGYTNSIWTLSISSATENGYVPWYIEACSSTLATTYSSGSYEERQIATTDLHHSCTSSHTGTSASAPLAAGICALVLESNPKLTWRDMQHIVVRTAKPANLVAKDWRTNAMGRNVSHAFGYGLMDAAAMITMAKRWTTVPIQYTCEVRSPQMEKFIPAKGYIELKLRAACENVRFLEHVQSKVTLTSSRRGDLHIYLVSPHGTRSTLLAQRPHDQAEQGFRAWPFMTVHSWGESPNGVWTLEVHNEGKPQNRAYLKEWTLVLHGTHDDPNRHLDAASLTPPPPPPSAGLEPHHSAHLRPPAHAIKQQVSSPPPPLPALGNHQSGGSPSDGKQEHPPAGRPLVHWSTYPPLPAPLPPGAAPPATARPPQVTQVTQATSSSSPAPPPTLQQQQQQQQQQQPPPPPPPQPPAPPVSTTTASYMTTFKTIVSSSTPATDQVVQSVSGQRVQVSPGGQVIKADFEIVSAPVGQGNQPESEHSQHHNHNHQHHNHNHNHHQHSSTHRPPVDTTRPGDYFDTSAAPVGSSRPNQISDIDQQVISKPPVVHLDGNKIELPMKPPVGMQDLLQQAPGVAQTTNQPPPMLQPNQHELDGNQIDLKMSKDYRSSGEQSIYGTSSNNNNNNLSAVQVATSADLNQLGSDAGVSQQGGHSTLGQSGARGDHQQQRQHYQLMMMVFLTSFSTTTMLICSILNGGHLASRLPIIIT